MCAGRTEMAALPWGYSGSQGGSPGGVGPFWSDDFPGHSVTGAKMGGEHAVR